MLSSLSSEEHKFHRRDERASRSLPNLGLWLGHSLGSGGCWWEPFQVENINGSLFEGSSQVVNCDWKWGYDRKICEPPNDMSKRTHHLSPSSKYLPRCLTHSVWGLPKELYRRVSALGDGPKTDGQLQRWEGSGCLQNCRRVMSPLQAAGSSWVSSGTGAFE